MRGALPLGFLLLLGLQEDPLEALLRDLGSDDIDVRERAGLALVERGDAGLAALERAERSQDPEVAARARELLRSRLSLDIDFEFDRKQGSMEDRLEITLSVTNRGSRESVVHLGGISLRLELLEAIAGRTHPARESNSISINLGTVCTLSEYHFRRLVPKSSCVSHWDLLKLPLFCSDEVRAASPVQVPAHLGIPGRYRLTASYAYAAEVYKSGCRRQCPEHSDPAKPWNLCSERAFRTQTEFVILP